MRKNYDIFSDPCPLQLTNADEGDPKELFSKYLAQLGKENNDESLREDLPVGDYTGDAEIDEQVDQVLRLAFRDYIHTWYAYLSPNQELPKELREITQLAVKSMSQR